MKNIYNLINITVNIPSDMLKELIEMSDRSENKTDEIIYSAIRSFIDKHESERHNVDFENFVNKKTIANAIKPDFTKFL